MGTAVPYTGAARRYPGRRMGWWAAWALVGVLALLLLTAAISGPICGTGTGDRGPSGGPGGLRNAGSIPARMRAAYVAISRRENVPVAALAAIGKVESDHGRNASDSSAGAQGPMQFMPKTFPGYRCSPGADVHDPMDAVCAAARYVKALYRQARAAGFRGRKAWAGTFCGYNSGNVRATYCEGGYGSDGGGAARIAIGYGLDPSSQPGKPDAAGTLNAPTDNATPAVAGAQTCPVDDTDGALPTGSGRWKIAPGAFSSAVPIDPLLKAFLGQVARHTSRPFILTTGSAGHSRTTTNGSVSEHSVGRAGDFGSAANRFPNTTVGPSGPASYGDELATAALVTAGLPPPSARRNERRGGITNATADFGARRVRVQVIWRSNTRDLGGNHTSHVHVGIKPLGRATHARPTVQHLGP